VARSTELQRHLDRFLGIPIVFLVGLMGGRRSLPSSPERIGVIQPSAIGDMVLISGLLLHLRRRYPDAEIHVFHGPYNGAAAELLPIDVVTHCCEFTHPLATLRRLREADLDVLINSAPWTRLTALLTAFSGACTKIGFRSAGQFIHPAFDIAVPYLSSRHEVENHRAVAELFGPLSAYELQIKVPDQQRAIELPYRRLVLMHISPGGSRAKQKSWPTENWAELARQLVERGWIIGFTGASTDQSAVDAVMSRAMLPRECGVSLVDRLSLPELCTVVALARLIITVDTGVAHLAAAMNASVVGLYGPTKFERWGCRNARGAGLNSPHPAAGYINYGFEQHPEGDQVMAALSVDAVAAAIDAMLEEPKEKVASA
jgi:ADP-heptose:LPS heptosyltransferase